MKRFTPIAVGTLAGALLALPGLSLGAPAKVAPASVGADLSSLGQLSQHIQLTIKLNGTRVFDHVITSRACGAGCATVNLPGTKLPLRAVALTHFGVPDIVIGLYSGGAHCCYTDQVYRVNPATRTVSKTEHNFLDAGARIEDLNRDGNFEFVSADARISDAGFTDYAHSPAPLQIWSFRRNRFIDSTRNYPARLAQDATRWLRAFHRQHGNGRGLIAAWAADEDLLGHPALVKSELAGALRAGNLGVPKSLGGPKPATFVAQLQKLLRRLRYTH
jgi:hypothetical protein